MPNIRHVWQLIQHGDYAFSIDLQDAYLHIPIVKHHHFLQFVWLSQLQKSPVPLQFPLPDVVIATDAMPTHWAIYFQGSRLPLSVSGPWSGSLCRAYIALQEHQAIAMKLCRMAFHISGKVVALYLDNSTAKAYLCNQSGTVSPFLSRLACWILNLTDKHGITLISAYIPTHLNVEANYLSQDWMLLEWHLLPQVAQVAFHLWGLPEEDLLASSHSTQCQHYYTLESPHWGPWGWMPSTILGHFR